VDCADHLCAPGFDDKKTYVSQSASPNGAYLVLTRSDVGLGPVNKPRTSMMVVGISDAPVVVGMSKDLEQKNPLASDGAKVGHSLG
jgi:hypothetical protein